MVIYGSSYILLCFQVIEKKVAKRDGNYECGVVSEIKFQRNCISLDISSTTEEWKMRRANRLSV